MDTALDSGQLKFNMETEYPKDGAIVMKVGSAPAGAVLALRVPSWCESYSLKVNGADAKANCTVKDGYAFLKGPKNGDSIELTLEMPVVALQANPRVREDIGKVAVRRGPMVYCIEEADNGKDLHRVFLPKDAAFKHSFDQGFLGVGATLLESQGKRLSQDDWDADTLYRKAKNARYEDITLKWVPYYLWANRGAGEMVCWVREI